MIFVRRDWKIRLFPNGEFAGSFHPKVQWIYANLIYILSFSLTVSVSHLEAQQTPATSEYQSTKSLHYEVNFGRKGKHGRFITARELSIWASSRNLELIPDCPGRGLEDWEAELVDPQGMEFELDLPGKGRSWLYLDLAGYYPAGEASSEELRGFCREEEDLLSYKGAVRYELPSVRWLEVWINDRPMKTIYMGGGGFPRSPVRILIEREYAPERWIRVKLRPSPGDSFFAVWDAWVSSDRPEY